MITLTKLKEIAAYRGLEICIADANTQYTWNDIVQRTEARVAFLRRTYNDDQLRSASYLSKNNVELICWLAAFATLGIPTNGLDYSLPVSTLSKLIDQIKPGLLLVSFNLYKPDDLNSLNINGTSMLAIDAPTDSIINKIGEHHSSGLEQLLSEHTPPPFRAVSLTSGTSSIPKLALRYQSFDSRRFSWFTERFGFTNRDGFMLILPLYHAAGNGWARMFMGLGAPLFLVDYDNEQEIIRTLAINKVKTTVMTPNLVAKMTDLVDKVGGNHHLRWILVGGSYFPVKSKLQARATFGNIFCEYYGCTETGVNVLSDAADMLECPESVGRVFDGNNVLILDENNLPLSNGNKGRVAISSYMLMDEYGDGSKPFININNEKYFLMADYGYMDESGRLFLSNRNGEVRSGYDIYKIEEKIRSLPCIKDVALITVRHKDENYVQCIFSTNQHVQDKFTRLINKIKEQAFQNNVINFDARKVDKVPYSPSGKVRFNDVVNLLKAA